MTVDRTADAGTGNSVDLDASSPESAAASASAQPGTTRTATAPALEFRPGRWIANWDAENKEQWETAGRSIARRNLNWSIFAEFLGFVVWQLWSIVVVQLPAAGFTFTTSEIFWLISMPSLVGATLRIPYTFMVPRFGGRNWTIVSALLLLIPSIGLAMCVSNPETPFGVMLLVAALAGFGGGNFASSMANITFFYPAREKGWALGLNAAGGNLGAAVAQLAVPIVITLLAAGTVNLPMAGLMWVPFILLAAFGAYKYMNNLTSAKGDVAGSVAALKEPHLWVMAFLYIGTFGSFIGFAGVFPKLIKDYFPEFSTIGVGTVALSLAFLGPLVGSLARPYGGRMADRMGGARMTVSAFASMAVITLTMIWTLPLKNFWLFLVLFLMLFTASGFGNGATYRMIPVIFATNSRAARSGASSVATQRLASSALGLISAIGAYGGFLIPQVLNASNTASGSYTPAFYGFVGAYALMLVVCWASYIRNANRNAMGHV
ncbi:MFS transporter, NNP family, nitrate/nitrite transporter [Pseudarthrobacter equi]|uniref:MFS transporter, NNP family, nitrate/nitrite transporter n=1 Tax=Pseudarthrobacter equi TaxID=728066 RepID=A0A1H1XEP4_9MICC|nr:MFS transporter [Pseudarthrobacter equi]SDT07744.1 MFS transporter, NNP family, nitrate/nitrite transporter [Pseudarthrobacter equi]